MEILPAMWTNQFALLFGFDFMLIMSAASDDVYLTSNIYVCMYVFYRNINIIGLSTICILSCLLLLRTVVSKIETPAGLHRVGSAIF